MLQTARIMQKSVVGRQKGRILSQQGNIRIFHGESGLCASELKKENAASLKVLGFRV